MQNERIGEFPKKCHIFFVTMDDDGQPRVRPFGAYLVIDGKANYDEAGKDPYQQALAAASEFSQGAFHALVVDTDSGAFSMGLAREIANRMQAYYMEML